MQFLSAQGYTYEVLVVDDGSADRTPEIVEGMTEEYPRLNLLRLAHRGKAYAVRKGVLESEGERILFTDADLSAPISEASALMRCLDNGYDIAIGSRNAPGARRYGEPVYRHVLGRGFNLLVRLLTGIPFQDTQCGFKLFTREAARDVFTRSLLYAEGAHVVTGPMVTAMDVEILHIARRRGYRAREVGVEWHYSAGSKVRPTLDTYRMMKDLLRVRWNDLRRKYERDSTRR